MISSLSCQNFRCFQNTGSIELAPLTLLVGENNSGKSSLLQALFLPALTLQSEDPSICLKLFHEDYDFGSFKDLIFNHDETQTITLCYGMDINSSANKKQQAQKTRFFLEFTYGYLPKRKEVYLAKFILRDTEGDRFRVLTDKYSNAIKVHMRDHDTETSYLPRIIERNGAFFEPRYNPYTTYEKLENKFDEQTAESLLIDISRNMQIMTLFTLRFRKTYLLGPLRGYPRRTYLASGEVAEKVGARGELAWQNFSTLIERGKREDKEKIGLIRNALYQLGFVKGLDIHRIGTRHYEFWTKHTKSALTANLVDTGFGLSQVFPVIISLYTSPEFSTLLYEQPEIHLHPAAQGELGSIIAKAVSADKRIVVETHSENLILRVQTEVAKGNLNHKDVMIYYIEPNVGGHQIISINLDNKGRFLNEWPKGFFEETYQESLKLSKARREG